MITKINIGISVCGKICNVQKMQSCRGSHSKIMKNLTDDEFTSIPELFTNISAYQNKFVPQIRLAHKYVILTNIYSKKQFTTFLYKKELRCTQLFTKYLQLRLAMVPYVND
jgi:hypothetical protein